MMITFLVAAILVVLILAFFPDIIRAIGLIFLVLLLLAVVGHFTHHDDERQEKPAVITSPTPSIAPTTERSAAPSVMPTVETPKPAEPQAKRKVIQQ